MPTQQKIDIVLDISNKLEKAKGIYFTDYLGLNVAELTELRKKFFAKKIDFKVIKNTLLKRSIENVGYEGLDNFLTGPTAIAIAYDDPVVPARIFREFSETHDLPKIKAFIFEGDLMDNSKFTQVANLPSREDLFARLVSCLSSPMRILVVTLRNPLVDLINVLNELKEKKTIVKVSGGIKE